MGPKIRKLFAVLRFRPVPHAIRKNRFKPIEFDATNVRSDVDDHACHMLADAGSHHASLAMIERESFLMRDDCN